MLHDPSTGNAVPEESEALFGTLHTALVHDLLGKIKSGLATSADLSVARQLLKDNNVTSVGKAKPIQKLALVLPFKTEDEDADHRQVV